LDINNQGQVAGSYIGPDNRQHGFLLDVKSNRFRSIPDAPGTTNSGPVGLNDRGQITIQGESAEEATIDFLLDDGEFTRLIFPGAVETGGNKVNNSGEVAGYYVGADAIVHGSILRQGRYRTVDFPGATHNFLNARNSRGQIVGFIIEGDVAQPSAVRGALLSRGKLTLFDYPGPFLDPPAPSPTTSTIGVRSSALKSPSRPRPNRALRARTQSPDWPFPPLSQPRNGTAPKQRTAPLIETADADRRLTGEGSTLSPSQLTTMTKVM
jgi:hypothetical protein